MDFDLRTCDAAYRFVLEFLSMTPDEFVTEYNIECENNYESFWDRNLQRIQSIDVSTLRIMAFHVLGSLDDCDEIKRNGLWNLQMVLSNDTILTRSLRKHGIRFDIAEKILYAGSKSYNIDYERYKEKQILNETEEMVKNVARRIFYDCCVNGFLVNDDIFDYGTQIHERPEFLLILGELLPEAKSVDKYWKKHSKSYRVDFYVTNEQAHRFTFELDEYRDPPYAGWQELDDELKLKKWMLSHAIYRADNKLDEVYLYVRDELIVPPEQIITVTELSTLPQDAKK